RRPRDVAGRRRRPRAARDGDLRRRRRRRLGRVIATSERRLTHPTIVRRFRVALAFLPRLPGGRDPEDESELAASLAAFPLVGAPVRRVPPGAVPPGEGGLPPGA